MRDLEDLVEDIKVYMELEQGKNAEYWRDITIIVHDEISRLMTESKQSATNENTGLERRDTMSTSVSNEVNKVFAGKNEAELTKLKANIENKLRTQTNIDTGKVKFYSFTVWILVIKVCCSSSLLGVAPEEISCPNRESAADGKTQRNSATKAFQTET